MGKIINKNAQDIFIEGELYMTDGMKKEGMLSPYRVLDLTDEKGLMCGKLLGDLGADVVKIEKPGGDPARNIGPFYHDQIHPEKSLFWLAYNTNKRGITLDIENEEGRDIFKRLGKEADFVIESFDPGTMDKLGLGYADLEKINPSIIVVSITPFGQTGPYSHYKGPDIVTWAMGGRMYSLGDADRPPIRISHLPQTYLQAGLEGAMAATMALYHRHMTGEGQHIDLSIQAAAAQPGDSLWDRTRLVRPRRTGMLTGTRINVTRSWPCKDGGLISWVYMPASFEGVTRNAGLVKWMTEEGLATDFLGKFDWASLDYNTVTQETIDQLEEPTGKFFLSHTKSELLAGAVEYRILFYPQFTTSDILKDVQLIDRGFWNEVEHPELGASMKYPGAFALTSETPPGVSRRAPLIGEHNREVYEEIVGLTGEDISKLARAKII
jgi:crotonobetainyl-CoA:carnitine CoA-transferase CaiB-like acyl-CoA transferase